MGEEIILVERKSMNSSSGSSWVVNIENLLPDTDRSVELARWSKPSIYRVPNWLKNMPNNEAYQPHLVSLGPFHHGEPDLVPMEEHKRRAVLHIIRRTHKSLSEFAANIYTVADELMDSYDNLDEKWREDRDRFVEVMVTDGCFLLEIMKGLSKKAAPPDYAPNDPVFSLHGMLYLHPGIRADMVVIENQLPLLALYRLEEVWRGATPLNEEDINRLVLNFMCYPRKGNSLREGILDNKLCLHPLDIYHKDSFGLHPSPPGSGEWERSMHCAEDLKEAGIQFKRNTTQEIQFKNGVLSLPALSIHDGTEKVFLNLLAFERLHGGNRSEATAHMIFMDNLINSERDVALLRRRGIIENLLTSDTDAASLFNKLSKGAVLSPYSRLHDVRRDVNSYCNRLQNRWLAIFRHTYLSNPWVFISLVAAVILLVANLLQTFYSVESFYHV